MTLHRIHEYRDKTRRLWVAGLPRGDLTGWPECDQFFSVAPGQLTIITGWPSSGKSQWLDALILNLARQGWIFGIHSPENLPSEIHISKWLMQFLNMPFGNGPSERMTLDEVNEGMDELHKRFVMIGPKVEDEAMTMLDIIEDASTLFGETIYEKFGLVIDPWNDLRHEWAPYQSETKYIGDILGTLRRWARLWKVHVFLVAHPAKQVRENGKLPVPRPDMISGSVNFWNRADNCITVQRELGDDRDDRTDIYFQKVKFAHIGHAGQATLRYVRKTGRYESLNKPLDFVPGGKR